MAERKPFYDLDPGDWQLRFARGDLGPGATGPVGAGILAQTLKGLATLPQRAIGAASEYEQTGRYDPGPAFETGMLGFGASIPGVAMRGLGTSPSVLPSLYLQRKLNPYSVHPSRAPGTRGTHHFDVVNESGSKVANMTVTYKDRDWAGRPIAPEAHVDSLTSVRESPLEYGTTARGTNWASHSLGSKEIRSLMLGLKNEFPNIEKISAYRVSGARTLGEGSANAELNVPKVSDARMQAYLDKMPESAKTPVQPPTPSPRPRSGSFVEQYGRETAAERLGQSGGGAWPPQRIAGESQADYAARYNAAREEMLGQSPAERAAREVRPEIRPENFERLREQRRQQAFEEAGPSPTGPGGAWQASGSRIPSWIPEDIRPALEAYQAGRVTPAQEQMLRQYFDVPGRGTPTAPAPYGPASERPLPTAAHEVPATAGPRPASVYTREYADRISELINRDVEARGGPASGRMSPEQVWDLWQRHPEIFGQ